jgi:hypothetical protein
MNACLKTGILQAHLDGEPVSAKIWEHVDQCAKCAKRLESMRSTASDVDALLDLISQEPVPAFQIARSHRRAWRGVAIGALAAAVLLAILLTHRPRQPQIPVVENRVEMAASEPAPVASVPTAPPQRKRRAPTQVEYFWALRDMEQPIQLGTVVPVSLPASLLDAAAPESARIQAEVLVGDDGRPQAIRFLQ